MLDINNLRNERGSIVNDMHALLEKSEKNGRGLNAEEQATYDKMFKAQEEVGVRISNLERQNELSRQMAQSAVHQSPDAGSSGSNKSPEESKIAAFNAYLKGGQPALRGAQVNLLQSDDSQGGGFLVTPVQFANDLIKEIDNIVFIRNFAKMHTISQAASLGVPSLDVDPSDADWTSEVKDLTEDDTMKFGNRQLTPHPLAKLIKVSDTLLRKTDGSVDDIVRERLAYKFGIAMEQGYLNGTGAGQPLGVFTASANGISTDRDVSTDNTATEIRADGLINAKYAMKSGYLKGARWCFHRDGMKQISKLKDGNGQYLWSQGLRAGETDTILSLPVDQSEYAPNTFTSGSYVGGLFNWNYYYIVDALNMTIKRLDELYAVKNQVGFIGRAESDGMPVLSKAFVRVKLA